MPRRAVPRRVRVTDRMQKGYVYWLTVPTGRGFDPDFKPELTPREMLALGIFGGKYMSAPTRSIAQLFRRRCVTVASVLA